MKYICFNFAPALWNTQRIPHFFPFFYYLFIIDLFVHFILSFNAKFQLVLFFSSSISARNSKTRRFPPSRPTVKAISSAITSTSSRNSPTRFTDRTLRVFWLSKSKPPPPAAFHIKPLILTQCLRRVLLLLGSTGSCRVTFHFRSTWQFFIQHTPAGGGEEGIVHLTGRHCISICPHFTTVFLSHSPCFFLCRHGVLQDRKDVPVLARSSTKQSNHGDDSDWWRVTVRWARPRIWIFFTHKSSSTAASLKWITTSESGKKKKMLLPVWCTGIGQFVLFWCWLTLNSDINRVGFSSPFSLFFSMSNLCNHRRFVIRSVWRIPWKTSEKTSGRMQTSDYMWEFSALWQTLSGPLYIKYSFETSPLQFLRSYPSMGGRHTKLKALESQGIIRNKFRPYEQQQRFVSAKKEQLWGWTLSFRVMR